SFDPQPGGGGLFPDISNGDEVTTYAYDKLNRRIRTLDAEGYVTDTRYDAAGNVTDTFAYARRLVDDPSALQDSPLPLQAQPATPDAADRHVHSAYDAQNRLVEQTDAAGFSTSYEYDDVGNNTAATSGRYLLAPGDSGYDPAQAALAKPETVRYTYDAMNR